ncbi:MAG: hypothetical protein GY758_22440 [Fuerstiella sp.]|nr:hypothetical protein [Fuerstiella sp.]MCP4510541.1 hypothetical protein [Fuerstiella sp.]MDG2131064.1 hypothetical protein [Fuerstiella sp.]
MVDHIDEFESIFRRAERDLFCYVDVPVASVVVVSDGGIEQAEAMIADTKRFVPRLESVENWRTITADHFRTVAELLEVLNQQQTDLIVTHRHLHEKSFVPQHSLGVYLDVLTQTTSIPVFVLPGSAAEPGSVADRVCDRVMVVADHITGDHRLINYGVRMCREGGTVWLCHVEDNVVFGRYMQAIERIPEIDSDDARILIENQLLKDAQEFIDGCSKIIHEEGPNVTVNSVVTRGHHLRDYRKLIEDNDVDLLVLNTKDDDQLAMHGRAYSLSVELTDVSMLLL